MLKHRMFDGAGICGREQVYTNLSPLAAAMRRDPAILDEALDLVPEAVVEDDGYWLWQLSKEIFRRNQAE